jgi:hypothetical protein
MRSLSIVCWVDSRADGPKTLDPGKTWTPHQTVRRAAAASLAAWTAIIGVAALLL